MTSDDDSDDFRDAYHEALGGVFGHRKDCPSHPDNIAKGSGPAQVATPAYRENYEAIFGRVPVGKA
jgi:hypothetical protein